MAPWSASPVHVCSCAFYKNTDKETTSWLHPIGRSGRQGPPLPGPKEKDASRRWEEAVHVHAHRNEEGTGWPCSVFPSFILLLFSTFETCCCSLTECRSRVAKTGLYQRRPPHRQKECKHAFSLIVRSISTLVCTCDGAQKTVLCVFEDMQIWYECNENDS